MFSQSLGSWTPLLQDELTTPRFQALWERVESSYETSHPTIYPPKADIFNAFLLTPPENVRVLICGQDPYVREGQAHGLSFSVRPGVAIPKSLQNIFIELQSDLGCDIPTYGCLEKWAKEGVFLLNNVLTVYEGQAGSHSKWGWQSFTSAVLRKTREFPQPICFILWGKHAQETAAKADVCNSKYPRLLIESSHPSPLGVYRSFRGSKPFSRANEFLVENGSKPINWSLTD